MNQPEPVPTPQKRGDTVTGSAVQWSDRTEPIAFGHSLTPRRFSGKAQAPAFRPDSKYTATDQCLSQSNEGKQDGWMVMEKD